MKKKQRKPTSWGGIAAEIGRGFGKDAMGMSHAFVDTALGQRARKCTCQKRRTRTRW